MDTFDSITITIDDQAYLQEPGMINQNNIQTFELSNSTPGSERPIKVHHIYNLDTIYSDNAGQNGVVTVVSFFENNVCHYGVSVCMPGDNFDKKYGINQAMQRANTGSKYHGWFRYTRKKTYHDIKLMILMDMVCNMKDTLPRWAFKTVKYELKEFFEFSDFNYWGHS